MTVYRGRIVSGGRLQIPADVRKALALDDGDSVRIEIIDGEMRIRSYQAVIKAIQAELRHYIPAGVDMVDDLIADRRADAARE